jgi:adenine-specific DNA-methyltransferase
MEKLEKAALLKPELLEKLSELFPQAFVDGKIDFHILKSLLGQHLEETNEKYQFTWNGKQNAIANAQKPSIGTLREDKQSSKNFANTENLYIEGDNLEVLKLLQKTYQGKIKMIYIDPPYNTGNDFVYKDDFKDNIKNYLEQTKQANKSNAETSGRYHTDWLNMMYPRLMLARNLLSEDGVIFISIDYNEQSNLKKVCDEIYGEINFMGEFIWEKHKAPKNDNKLITINHEQIFVFAKNIQLINFRGMERNEDNLSNFENPDNDLRGPWISGPLLAPTFNEKNVFKILSPTGREYLPPKGKCWSFSLDRIKELIFDNRVWFGKDGTNVPRIKRFLNELPNEIGIRSVLLHDEYGGNQLASNQLKKLFDNAKIFDYSKPVDLIKFLINRIISTDSLIIDFFSGSGTTAHAVMTLNAEDGGNRKFIMVQLPETTSEDSEAYKAGYKNICEIGKERIRRAGEKIKQEMLEKNPTADVKNLDIGFKVFKLDTTNIKPWDGTQEISDGLLDASKDVVKEDREPLDLVYELMLMYGVFNEPIEEIKINGKTMYSIADHFLMICLFDEINEKDIKEIIKLSPKNIIFNDAGFKDDNVKLNSELTLKNHGVEDIKSL